MKSIMYIYSYILDLVFTKKGSLPTIHSWIQCSLQCSEAGTNILFKRAPWRAQVPKRTQGWWMVSVVFFLHLQIINVNPASPNTVYIYMLCISLHRMSCKTVAQPEMMEGDDSNWLVIPDHPYSLLGFDALKAFASAAEILGGSSRAKNQPGHDSNSICNTIQHQHDILYPEHVDTYKIK